MNKNKIIALILVWLVIVFFWWVFSVTKDGADKQKSKSTEARITVWQYWYSEWALDNLLQKYKSETKSKDSFIVTTFVSYKDYKEALKTALINGKWPDIFTLNNRDEISFYENSIVGLNPEVIPSDEMKNNFDPVFAKDLIQEYKSDDGTILDFIVWVPLSFDYLVLFSDLRYTKGKNISTWSWVNEVVTKLSENNSSVTPIAIWNGSTVKRASDIFSQLLVNKWAENLRFFDSKELESTWTEYYFYGDKSWENWYNKKKWLMDLRKTDSLKLFSQKDAGMAFWYLRDIKDLIDYGANLRLLKISNFPNYIWNDEEKLSIDYNYFVINKKTEFLDNSLMLMKYFLSENGQREFMANTKYNFPARLDILEERLAEKLDSKIITRYSNIYSNSLVLTSFKGVSREEFDNLVEKALDKTKIESELRKVKNILTCRYTQAIEQKNLTNSCN